VTKILKRIFRKALLRLNIGKASTQGHGSQENPQNEQHYLKPLRLLAEQGDWIKLEEKGRELLLQNPHQHEAIELVPTACNRGGA